LKRSLEIAPDLDVVVRANQDKDIELLYQLGAREVVQPEFEASLEISTHLLTGMGLPLRKTQREMQKIRSSHYLALRPERSSYEISRDLKVATQDMNKRWYALPNESPLAGMTLEETDLRQLTGVSLMAIRRAGGEEVDYPDGQTTLEEGDRLLIIGEAEELAAFDELAKGEAAVPKANTSCQWLVLPEGSPAIAKTLGELAFPQTYGVQVQAIRREGRFIRFPGEEMDLQMGDRLLLCGHSESLIQISDWASTPEAMPILPIPVLIGATLEETAEIGEELLPPDDRVNPI
ncbi:MAG: TrkA C-terminal domain-containing protein, partial [Leptolyngbyaceae cyanobacterium bins.59]|nr:TrkA C-terminal domain-containing protein [Leptolyngbyaceae cyanobacterium bins.59]